jgi:hypothetical protein
MRLGEEDGARSKMIAAHFVHLVRVSAGAIGVADDGEIVAKRLERRKARGAQIELAPGCGRRPQTLFDPDRRTAGRPVHHLDAHEPGFACGGCRRRATGRHHGVEQRQRNGGANAFQDGAPRQVSPRDEHGCLTFVSSAAPRSRSACPAACPDRPRACRRPASCRQTSAKWHVRQRLAFQPSPRE